MQTPIEEKIINTILQKYNPDTGLDEDIEFLSTIELINQFQSIANIDVNLLANFMAENGFTLHFIGDEYKWKLYPNISNNQ